MHEHDMQAMNTSDWLWMTPTLLAWIVPAVLAVYLVGTYVGGDVLSASDRWRHRARFVCRACTVAPSGLIRRLYGEGGKGGHK